MRIFLLVLGIGLMAGVSHAETLQYESQVVRLAGTLVSGTGETPEGAPVSFPAVRLTEPVRVEAAPGDELNETEEDVELMQLVLEPSLMQQFKKLKGQQVIVSGTFMHAQTGHHYTHVLVVVQGIE